ncbi:MAG: hypothetical protein FD129_644, partial [bacterium]
MPACLRTGRLFRELTAVGGAGIHVAMRTRIASSLFVPPLLLLTTAALSGADERTLRPPAVPLVACDPYFSVWSASDRLTDSETVHWTGKRHALSSIARIDGKPYRLVGADPADVPPLVQTGLEVHPTRTVYHFAGAGVRVDL